MKIDKPDKTLEFDPSKVNQAYEELVAVFQKYKLGVGEILIAYGNLGYTLGASIDGHAEQGPNTEELQKLYYSNPTVGVAMMLSGLTITSWYETYSNQKLGKK